MSHKAFMSKAGDGPFFLDCDRVPGYTFGRPTEEYAALWAENEARMILQAVEPYQGTMHNHPRTLPPLKTPYGDALSAALSTFIAMETL